MTLNNQKYVFFGSPRFADIILKDLISAGHLPVAVVCNPDRPVGRKKIITPPLTKTIAIKNNIPVFQPENVNQIQNELKKTGSDFFVVAAYSQIIPKSIISIPRLGTLGVHPSLLPLYRGATPIQSALLAGEAQTGNSIYIIDEKMDHGPIITQATTSINLNETYLSLEKKLAQLGAKSLNQIIPNIKDKIISATPQNHDRATFTKKISTAEAEVDMISDDPEIIYKKIQALNPEPGPFTYSFPGYERKRVKLLSADFKGGELKITSVQPNGKNPINLK